MAPKRSVLLYLLGAPPDEVARAHGRFEDWFATLWRDDPVEVTVFDGARPARPPSPEQFAGAVITGSSASLTEPEHWMEIAVEFLRHAAGSGTPVLGVCFGHQLIGAAYGGSVVKNPKGWEISTHAVHLNGAGRADPLFEGIEDTFHVNLSHADIIDAETIAPANGLRILAGNDATDAQALAAGDAIRGVQFHPEFTADIVRGYIEARRDVLPEPDTLAARARDTPDAIRIFENFTRHWILKS